MGRIYFLSNRMKLFVALVLLGMIAQSQQGQIAEYVVTVTNWCVDANVPDASLRQPIKDTAAAVRAGLGSVRRRRLLKLVDGKNRKLWDPFAWAKQTGCTAAYNGCANAAGIPGPVAKCFQDYVVTRCVQKVGELCGC